MTGEKEKESPKVCGSPFRPKRHGSSWLSGSSEKSPTQIDVLVVTETITDSLQTLDTAKIRNSNTQLKEISEGESSSRRSSNSSLAASY